MTWVVTVRYISDSNMGKWVGQSVTLDDFLLEHHKDDALDIRVELFKKILQDIERKKRKMEQL